MSMSVSPRLTEILVENAITTGYRLTYLGNHFIGPVYKWTEKELDIRRPQFAVLFCLAHLGTLSARDVCELSGIPANSISRAVSSLLERKLVLRTDHGSDKRRGVLKLTTAGRKLYEHIIPMFGEREAQMLQPLSPQEQQQLSTLLAKIVLREDDWSMRF
jgi:DNA-binding MarR family transcriptional regulator